MCVYIVEHFLLSIYYKVTAKWFGPSEVEECIELIDGVAEACVWVGPFLQTNQLLTAITTILLSNLCYTEYLRQVAL